jgi:hypothetical protein
MRDVSGGLAHLITTETRLARGLAAAQAEAEGLLIAARSAAEQDEAGLQQAIERDALALADRIAAERDAELSRLTASAEGRAHRYQELPSAIIEELALELADRVLPPPIAGSQP